MPGKFELKKAKGGQFMFNLKAGNGRVILTSERYKSKKSAENGIRSVRTSAKKGASFDRRKSSKGDPYFVMVAGNREIIGRSEIYSGTSAMETGIRSVMKNGPGGKIDDNT